MHKLAALVEKGGVVFVGFNHKVGARVARYRLPQAGRHSKVQGHAAHQITRGKACCFQNPGQHGRGRCFAVRACNGQHMTALQDMLRQPLGATGVCRARFENGFHQGKFGFTRRQPAAADHVANHVQIGFELHLIDAKAFNQLDAQSLQLVAHGRVDACIAASDAVTRFSCQGGQASHEGAANSQYMYVHRGILGGAQCMHGRHNR